MIPKFKAGDRIRITIGDRDTGTVVDVPNPHLFSDRVVWAKWDNNPNRILYANVGNVELVLPAPPKYNEEEWI